MAVVLVGYLYFFVISVVLTVIDLRSHRLPNAIVLPSFVVAFGLFTLACLLGADWGALLRAALGMATLWLFYFVLRLLSRQGMGGGDVKLAGLVGFYLAWLGWVPLMIGALAAFVLGGVAAVVLLIGGRAHRRTAIPFGPWMLAGAWIGVVVAGAASGLLGSAA